MSVPIKRIAEVDPHYLLYFLENRLVAGAGRKALPVPAQAQDSCGRYRAKFAQLRLTGVEPPPAELGRPPVVRSATTLVSLATRLLPASSQGRYAEEFHGELGELARSGAGRSRQLAYAAHQVLYASQLRRELTSAHRREASP